MDKDGDYILDLFQGLLPSSISITVCWAFLLVEALLLVEVNVGLLEKKKMRLEEDELEIISIRTMAQDTLGEWGGALATVIYVFLGYTSMIAYASKSGEILNHLTNLPESVSGIFFTALFTILIFVGGTRTTDQVNQWLTVSMIGMFLIEICSQQNLFVIGFTDGMVDNTCFLLKNAWDFMFQLLAQKFSKIVGIYVMKQVCYWQLRFWLLHLEGGQDSQEVVTGEKFHHLFQ